MLKGKSTLVSGLPSGEVYKSLNIWVGNSNFATEKNIENAAVCFKVDKSWVQDKKIDKSSITLNRYNNKKWEQLSTSLSGEDDKYLYFTARTPGFSPFAITGKSNATSIQPASGNKNQQTGDTQDKLNGSTVANAIQATEEENNTSTPAKESKSTPGLEIFYGIASLLLSFLYKKTKTE